MKKPSSFYPHSYRPSPGSPDALQKALYEAHRPIAHPPRNPGKFWGGATVLDRPTAQTFAKRKARVTLPKVFK